MSIPTLQQTPRFRALDGLRGVAALLVVLLHVEWRNHITGTHFVRNGYLAVDLFFIISGLVIAANYATRIVGMPSSLRFLGLRFFRLYPLHIAMLGALIVLECCKLAAEHTFGITPGQQPFSGGMSFRSLVANIFLVHGLGWMRHESWNGPSWSISCECFAYVAFAIATLFGLIRSRLFLLCGTIIGAAAYAGIALEHGTLNVTADFGIVRCFAGFFFGVVIASYPSTPSFSRSKYARKYGIYVMAAVLLSMATLSGPMVVLVIPPFVFLVACLKEDQGSVARLLCSRPLQFLGRISYSVYMVHEIVVVCLLMVLKRAVRTSFDPNIGRVVGATNPWLGDVITLALVVMVVLIASQTYRLIEEPGRMFGRRLLRQDALKNEVLRPPVSKASGRAVQSEGY